jgi:predicted ATPase
VLGVREQPGHQGTAAITDALVEALGEKKMLLILDNCEHLVKVCAGLAEALLRACPSLRILATSREPLGVEGEVVWRVPALSLPDPQGPPTVSDLEGTESARLFAVRARGRDPTFVLTPQNARAVTEICRRLDGIPLAIELAAARVGTLSVEQIAEKLRGSLKLLSGRLTVSERHQTLQAALDWSYDLLGERERALFRRLSVFVGGWTLEAAEAVGTGEDVEEEDVVELISGLVDKSLVVSEVNREGEMRYGMLEPVRQYAWEKLEKLEKSEEVDKLRRQRRRSRS